MLLLCRGLEGVQSTAAQLEAVKALMQGIQSAFKGVEVSTSTVTS